VREFCELGADEYLRGDGVCVIEWADKVESALPAEHLRVEIEVVDGDRRRIRLTASGPAHEELLHRLSSDHEQLDSGAGGR
jgi:tRNA threonylcarbamoyladenosine biosynthesis protein TsaE